MVHNIKTENILAASDPLVYGTNADEGSYGLSRRRFGDLYYDDEDDDF